MSMEEIVAIVAGLARAHPGLAEGVPVRPVEFPLAMNPLCPSGLHFA